MATTFYSTKLANGLTVLGEVSPSSMSSAVGFFVKTGSRDETLPESGVSHFLEHMMFKGTPSRSAIDINLELGNLGAQANAFTSEENTVYYASVIPENFSAMQALLSDMLRPSLDPAEFDMEKKVILEEIALYQDRPHFFLFEKAFKDFFGEHPAGNSVLGSHESISQLSRDQMKEYFDRRYSPSNLVLAATGNFSWPQFLDDAERLCGGWKRYDVGRTTPQVPAKSSVTVYRKKNLTHSHAVLLAPGVSAQDESRYALSLLANILGDGSGSRMYWELVDNGLADSASCDSDERDGTGCFSAYVSTTPDKLDRVVEIARSIVDSALDFSDADLARAKAKVEARVVLNGELPMGRLMALGLEWNYREAVTPLSEIVRLIRAVNREDISNVLERYPLTALAEYRLLPEV
jgi:predicted Zn-dependent peptidase